ncbi:MAG: hypothetical protein RL077_327 [Verrucomicrobiota bacterium]|jgi:hypothetical protein
MSEEIKALGERLIAMEIEVLNGDVSEPRPAAVQAEYENTLTRLLELMGKPHLRREVSLQFRRFAAERLRKEDRRSGR